MVERARRWLIPHPDTPGSFRLGFIAAYIGVIGTVILYSSLVMPCDSHLPLGNTGMLAILLTLLVGMERLEVGRRPQPMSGQMAVGLILLRMLLLEGIVALDCTKWAVLLYPIVPFAAFFALNPLISNGLGLFYWVLTLFRWWMTNNGSFSDVDRLTAVVVFTLLLIFTRVIARNIERDERSREQTHQLLVELEASHRKLQAYASQVAELAAAEERNRLARDIHDSLGHHLTAINIQLEKALAYRAHNPEEADQAVRDAKQMASEALQDVRHSVSALRNREEATFSLRQALADLVRRMDSSTLTIDYHIDGDETGYARPVLTALYRVAQEGLTNVQKHAQARHVFLDIHLGEQEARLSLRDDGAGFDPVTLVYAASPDQGFGLQGIQERLELVRGHLSIASEPQEGTELTVTVPKNPAQLAPFGAS